MESETLSHENARTLVAELESLVGEAREDDVNPDLADTADRILKSLEAAPGPDDVIAKMLQNIGAWTTVMFREAKHSGPGSLKTLILQELFDLRGVIAESEVSETERP